MKRWRRPLTWALAACAAAAVIWLLDPARAKLPEAPPQTLPEAASTA